jgi:hypothetical protein
MKTNCLKRIDLGRKECKANIKGRVETQDCKMNDEFSFRAEDGDEMTHL